MLEEELIERNDDVEKLQSRCASLVTEKTEKTKQYEKDKNDKLKQIKSYRDELQQSVNFNNEMKQKLSTEYERSLELTATTASLQTQITQLNNKNVILDDDNKLIPILQVDLQHTKTLLDTTTEQLKFIEKSTQSVISEKSAKLDEVSVHFYINYFCKSILFAYKSYMTYLCLCHLFYSTSSLFIDLYMHV